MKLSALLRLVGAFALCLSISAHADAARVAARVYATWNPADAHPDIVLSSDLLTATRSTISHAEWEWSGVRATIPIYDGRWYWETTINFAEGGDVVSGVTSGMNPLNISPASFEGLVGPDASGTCYWNGIAQGSTGATASGTVIRHLVDFDQESYSVSINGGPWVNVSESSTYGRLPWRLWAIGSLYQLTPATASVTANFGASPFAFEVPAGANPGIFTDVQIFLDGFDRSPQRR